MELCFKCENLVDKCQCPFEGDKCDTCKGTKWKWVNGWLLCVGCPAPSAQDFIY